MFNSKNKTLLRISATLALTIATTLAGVLSSTLTANASESPIAKITVTPQDKGQFARIFSGEFDVIEFHDQDFVIYANRAQQTRLQEYGIPFTIEIQDMSTFYKDRFLSEQPLQGGAQLSTMGGYETFSEIVAHIDSTVAANPSIMTAKFSIGQSLEGRDLWVVKISNNPTVDEDEPEILLASLMHSREPAGAAVTLAVMDYLVSNYGSDPFVTNLVDTREIFILPVVNPDGYVYNELTNPGGGGLWRKNRRPIGVDTGVDLNRNHDSHWAYNDIGSSPVPSSQTYRGTAPFSEPETQALNAFILSRNFSVIHNHHSYSNLELWPLGYDRFYSVDEDVFQAIGDSLTQDNGYVPSIGWDLYPTNGEADDWAYTALNIPSFTVEIGNNFDGFWAAPSRIPTLIAENIQPNLFLISIADNPRKVGPPRSPVLTATPDTSTDGNLSLVWADNDIYNPGVSYDVTELTGYARLTDDAELDNSYWKKERFSLSSVRKHSGAFSWKANSVNRGYHWLTSVTPVRIQANDSLKFWTWFNIETDWDYFYVQVSTDGGFIYENLAHLTLSTNTNPNGQNLGNGITGLSGGWIEVAFDMSPYVGQYIHLRLAYYTDLGFLEEGIYIDDINLVDFYSSSAPAALGVTATNVDLSGKLAGDYYYLVQSIDAENQTGRNSNIVKVTVDTGCCDNPGDANHDGSFNIADVTFGITRIFGSGPAPFCQDEADANGDDAFNIADVTFGIARIFSSGPAPICGNTGT
ncbi:immune inhibitor A [bacterium AH-315-J21]|nr:immune inhibitor A [bacterium AH-315-J21]